MLHKWKYWKNTEKNSFGLHMRFSIFAKDTSSLDSSLPISTCPVLTDLSTFKSFNFHLFYYYYYEPQVLK